jgi:hypothetical protein
LLYRDNSVAAILEKDMNRSSYVDDWDRQALAAYIAEYLREDMSRGDLAVGYSIDSFMVREAIDAFLGGAAEDADYSGGQS